MSRATPDTEDRVYMADIERELGRDRSTIRVWESKGWLPRDLRFHRDDHGWRYWTTAQLERAKEWMRSRDTGRTSEQDRADRRDRVGSMLRSGRSVGEIADELGLSKSVVASDRRRLIASGAIGG